MDKISNDELKILLLRSRGNDDTAFEKLCRAYEGMLHKAAESFVHRIDMPREDIFQEALLAFSRAVATYDIEKKEVTFGLFAKICVRNALISLERKSNSKKRRAEKLKRDGESLDGQSDFKYLWSLGGEKIKLIEKTLRADEKQILGLFIDGLSYAEIAESLGISKKKVDNTLYRLRKKMKKIGIM